MFGVISFSGYHGTLDHAIDIFDKDKLTEVKPPTEKLEEKPQVIPKKVVAEKQFPGIKWAQRREYVFLTIELQDTQETQINLTKEGVLTFKGETHGVEYGFTMEFFTSVVKGESSFNTDGRNPIITLAKLDT